jgi:hypothetical protein
VVSADRLTNTTIPGTQVDAVGEIECVGWNIEDEQPYRIKTILLTAVFPFTVKR